MKRSNREMRLMDAMASFVVRHKKIIPLVALVLIVLSIFAAGRIRIKTEFKDLLPKDNPKIESYQEVNDRFSGGEKIIVVVEGGRREEMLRAADQFARRIRGDQQLMSYIRTLNVKADRQFIEQWGLLPWGPRGSEMDGRFDLQPGVVPPVDLVEGGLQLEAKVSF